MFQIVALLLLKIISLIFFQFRINFRNIICKLVRSQIWFFKDFSKYCKKINLTNKWVKFSLILKNAFLQTLNFHGYDLYNYYFISYDASVATLPPSGKMAISTRTENLFTFYCLFYSLSFVPFVWAVKRNRNGQENSQHRTRQGCWPGGRSVTLSQQPYTGAVSLKKGAIPPRVWPFGPVSSVQKSEPWL